MDNDTAVFLRYLPPHNVIGKFPLDIAEKILPVLTRKGVDILSALKKLDMTGKIAPILARKYVDIFRVSQEKYSRGVKDSHCVAIA